MMLAKNELKKIWQEHDFRPLKRFGQNFIIDRNIVDKIVGNLDLKASDTVLEIGPGFGEITSGLANVVKDVLAVEKDKKIVNILNDLKSLPKNVQLIEKDFLDFDVKSIANDEKIVVYGNLPYYITSSIIEKLICSIEKIKDIYLVIQKEVAERICAKPSSKDIGRLSLFVQYYTEPEVLFEIKKDSFYPVPKVESILLRLKPRKTHKVKVNNESFLFEIIKAAYGQRRKTILNSLSKIEKDKQKLSKLLASVNINPTARAENLSLEEFAKLENVLTNCSKN